jgi:hypothetical protein
MLGGDAVASIPIEPGFYNSRGARDSDNVAPWESNQPPEAFSFHEFLS